MQNHHHHNHHHHHHSSFDPALAWRFTAAIILNMLFVAVEFALGFRFNSAGLLADAGHNLSDAGSLIISLSAFYMLKKAPDSRFNYGFKRATVLAALLNSIILLGAVGVIIRECLEKFLVSSDSSGYGITLTATAGIVVNGITVLLLAPEREHDLNIKSAYWHMISDVLVSLGVAVSGVLIKLTGQHWIDPLAGLIIAAIIACSGWKLTRESLFLLLDGVPMAVDHRQIQDELLQISGVSEVVFLRIRALSTVENAAEAHIKIHPGADEENIRNQCRKVLHDHNIAGATLELSRIRNFQADF